MNIAVITIHIGANFGSVLQTYATHRILTDLGHNVKFVNYIPERVTYKRWFKMLFKSPKRFVNGIILFPNFLANNNIYGGFLNRNVNLSKSCYSIDDLVNNDLKSDLYIVGSDQVWNSIHNEGFNPVYYFSYLDDSVRKIAFSSSFGREKLEDSEMKEVEKFLSKFDNISVRENSAVNLLKSIGIKSSHTLDPTLLLDKDDWSKMATKRIISESYILLYIPYNIISYDEIIQCAKVIAKEKNLKIVSFSWIFLNEKGVDKTIKYASPEDFLSLFIHAEYVITNSFHGTAFSVNLNKQFLVYTPSGFATRLISLLDVVGLANRVVNNEEDYLKVLPQTINYKEVNSLLDKERALTIEYLTNAIG